MHPMRRLIALNEAPKKISAVPVSPEERDRVERAHRAQQLAQAKAAVFQLKAKAMHAAQLSVRSEFYGPWDQAWVVEMRATIKMFIQRAKASSQEEHEYQLEDNPAAQPGAIDMLECIAEGIAGWWEQKKDTLEWSDARYRLGEYMDAHRRTEQSDDMSRLQAEDEMLRHMQYLGGGFGSVADMDKSLDMITSLVEFLQRHSDAGWSRVGETSTDIIKRGIPVIIAYCKLIESIP